LPVRVYVSQESTVGSTMMNTRSLIVKEVIISHQTEAENCSGQLASGE